MTKKNSGQWQPGQSGNPAGRPPRRRDLTKILKSVGGGKMLDVDGKHRERRRVVARLIWQFATTGSCVMPTGEVDEDGKPATRTLQPQNFDEWFAAVKWIFNHVDGPPKMEMDVTSGDESINSPQASVYGMVELVALYDSLRARAVAQGDEGGVSEPLAAADRATG